MPHVLETFADVGLWDFSVAQNSMTPPAYEPLVVDANATVKSDSYMGYTALDSYDLTECTQLCEDSDGCDSCMR